MYIYILCQIIPPKFVISVILYIMPVYMNCLPLRFVVSVVQSTNMHCPCRIFLFMSSGAREKKKEKELGRRGRLLFAVEE